MTDSPAIYGALTEVMRAVQSVGKDDENTAQGGGFKFRGIDALLNAVGPKLREHGVLCIPEVTDHHLGEVEVGRNRTRMANATVMVRYTFYASDGSNVSAVVPGEAMDAGDKATPKALSQAFKYALVQALAIPTGDPDPDSHSYERGDAPQDPVQTPERLRSIIDRRDALPDEKRKKLDAWVSKKVWNDADGWQWADILEGWWPQIEGLLDKAEADTAPPKTQDTADPTLLDGDGSPM